MVQAIHDELIGLVSATVAETDKIEWYGRGDLESRVSSYPSREALCKVDMMPDEAPKDRSAGDDLSSELRE